MKRDYKVYKCDAPTNYVIYDKRRWYSNYKSNGYTLYTNNLKHAKKICKMLNEGLLK